MSGADINDTSSLFPLTDCPKWFNKTGKGRIARVKPDGAQTLVEELQPYNTGDMTLLRLQTLDATDKHRVLTVTVPIVGLVGFSYTRVPGKEYEPITKPIFTARLEHNAIVARLTIKPPTPEVQVDIQFTPQVSFGHDFGLGPHTWTTVELKRLLLAVDDVIQKFTKYF